jgi:type IV secretory pathway TraG/TraD family ATPase VirD4
MFSHNLKDKFIMLGFFLLVDVIFYPWMNALIFKSLGAYTGFGGFIQPAMPILNWVSVFSTPRSLQLFIIIHLAGLVLFVIYNPYKKVSFDLDYDKEGKPIALKTGEHGTARLSTYKELKHKNPFYTPKAQTDSANRYPLKKSGLILSSQYSNKKKEVEVVYLEKDSHSIILGATGSGKTVSFIKPTILTLADAGESMIIHDPKGELKRDYAGYLREVKGYDVIEMNYSDTRMGDQFNQLENVERRLKLAQDNSFKAKACDTIIRYLTHILTEGEINGDTLSPKEKAKLKYNIMGIGDEQGILAIKFLRDFFATDYALAWQMIDANFYIFYRKERITFEALALLKEYNVNDLVEYFKARKEYYEKYLLNITTDRSDLIEYANREIRELNLNIEILQNQTHISITHLVRYFTELKREFHNKYKDEEAEATIYARSIANMLITGSDGDHQKGEKIWEDTPKALLVSLIIFICRETHLPTSAHMGSVFRFLSVHSETEKGQMGESKLKMDTLFDNFEDDDPCRLSQTSVRIAGDRTRSSILVSAVAPIEIFSDPNVIDQGSRTSFSIKDIAKKPTAVFVLSAGRDENPIYSVLTSLFIEQTYVSLVEDTKTTNDLRLPIRVNYLLDELGNMAQIPELGSKVSLARSRGIRFNIVLQSFTQLDTHYKNDKHTIMENTSWFYLLTQDYETAKQISDRLGSYTAEGESSSLNSSSPDTVTGGASKQKMARPLYTPDEIMRFKIGTGLAILSSDYPAKVNLLPDYAYPQAEDVKKHKATVSTELRPKQQTNFFVPEIQPFVQSYKSYNKTSLFDMTWGAYISDGSMVQVKQPAEDEAPGRGARKRPLGGVSSPVYKPDSEGLQTKPKYDEEDPDARYNKQDTQRTQPKVASEPKPETKKVLMNHKPLFTTTLETMDMQKTLFMEEEGLEVTENTELDLDTLIQVVADKSVQNTAHIQQIMADFGENPKIVAGDLDSKK